MPAPRHGETREQFLDRYMGDPEAVADFPDPAQRFRVGVGVWEGRSKAASRRPLYVARPLLNSGELHSWARIQGFGVLEPEGDMHVTIAHSRDPVDWSAVGTTNVESLRVIGGPRMVQPLGDDGAVVLRFQDSHLQERHHEMRRAGARWGFARYMPHVTLTYDGQGMDTARVEPYRGDLVFGPEKWSRADGGFEPESAPAEKRLLLSHRTADLECRLKSLHRERQVSWGWFSVISVGGRPIVDADGDVLNEENTLDVAHDFIRHSRQAKVMHEGQPAGEVVESLVFTTDLQKALGIDLGKVGWFGGIHWPSRETWARIVAGELAMFSLSGPMWVQPRQEAA